MNAFSTDARITLAVLAGFFLLLVLNVASAEIVALVGLAVLLFTGVLSTSQALAGFANEGMMTVAVLYVVVAALRETGVMGWIVQRVFGSPRTTAAAQLRLIFPLAAVSAFMNNTPLVGAMLPAVIEWAKKFQIPVSKLLMPMSFATILGGLCTLIGTSTNVVVAGLMQSSLDAGAIDRGMGFFTLTAVGVPCALAGIAYMVVASRWLLPAREPALRQMDDPRAYTVEMRVAPKGPIDGKTIQQAGLRHLTGMYVAEVERDGEVFAAVDPQLRLKGNDQLVFVGIVDSVVELQRIRGLVPTTNQVFELEGPRSGRMLVEAVVSDRCPLLGQSIREARFRSHYNAAVIAVARSGERLRQKIGDIVLQPGDTLLLEAQPVFMQRLRDSRDFFLVSRLDSSAQPRYERAAVALAILLGMVVLATAFEQLPFFIERGFSVLHAALIAAGLMLVTRCCSIEHVRQMIDWQVLITIAATLGLGLALSTTGLAAELARGMVALAGPSPLAQLAMIYLMTMLLTELLTNTTAVVLAYPIALATAGQLGVDHMPFVVALAIAGSCGFATPIGYQTNLMVYGPGGYRFVDFLRFGGPLNLVVATITLIVTPHVFPF
ncbi:MAG TPA: SLC13 family permease [Gammaproteobacteria bacterium]|nr:SLC13 family permease [Gammaproteobacteria bacterium]